MAFELIEIVQQTVKFLKFYFINCLDSAREPDCDNIARNCLCLHVARKRHVHFEFIFQTLSL